MNVMKAELVVVYRDPNNFWKEVSPHLRKDEARNSLILGRAFSFVSDATDCLYQSALFKESQLIGAFVLSRHRDQLNLLSSPLREIREAELLWNNFSAFKKDVSGVVTEAETAKLIATILKRNGLFCKVQMDQGIYRCCKVNVPENPLGFELRPAKSNDVTTLTRWLQKFHQEAVPNDPPIQAREVIEQKIKQNTIYVLEDRNRIVSMAGWGRDLGTSCSINLVYTPKKFRRRGFGSLATALLTKMFLEQGRRETNLYTDLKNPTSNKIYQSIGYEFVCASTHLALI